ncbi:MAG: hypothetical protein K2Q22_15060, partial [Cytophagales bacterium]|nr:hypothetical protein [Cytophagales bacterium]
YAPIWVFSLVANVDGVLDKKEVKQFEEDIAALSGKLEYDLPENIGTNPLVKGLLQGVYASISREFTSLYDKIDKVDIAPLEGIKRAIQVIESKGTKDEVAAYRNTLLSIGQNVANSSGGVMLFRNSISKVEASMLEEIKIAIGLSEQHSLRDPKKS